MRQPVKLQLLQMKYFLALMRWKHFRSDKHIRHDHQTFITLMQKPDHLLYI